VRRQAEQQRQAQAPPMSGGRAGEPLQPPVVKANVNCTDTDVTTL